MQNSWFKEQVEYVFIITWLLDNVDRHPKLNCIYYQFLTCLLVWRCNLHTQEMFYMLLSFHMQTFCGYICEPVKFQNDIYRLSINIESHSYVCSCLLCQNYFTDMSHLIIVFCIALQTELRSQMNSSSKRKKTNTSY